MGGATGVILLEMSAVPLAEGAVGVKLVGATVVAGMVEIGTNTDCAVVVAVTTVVGAGSTTVVAMFAETNGFALVGVAAARPVGAVDAVLVGATVVAGMAEVGTNTDCAVFVAVAIAVGADSPTIVARLAEANEFVGAATASPEPD